MERYKILYEDQDVLVIHKYPGLAVQSARSMTPDLVSMLRNRALEQGEAKPYLGLVNRLDQPVEGILLVGKNEKAAAEQKMYISKLKLKPPEQIVECAYEKVMRDDILLVFEYEDLPKKQVKELLKLKEPITVCYERWLHNDYSHMDMLKDSISELANDMIRHRAEQKKVKKEPER